MKATTLLAICAAAAAAPVSEQLRVNAQWAAAVRDRVPMEADVVVLDETSSWTRGERAFAETEMRVHMMMKNDAHMAKLEKVLYAVSDPRSPEYGQHLSLDQLAVLAPIPDAAVATLRDFLASHDGVRSVAFNHNKDIASVLLTVEAAEALFSTRIHSWTHKNLTGVNVLRAAEPYSLPSAVAAVVAAVGDLLALPAIRSPIAVPTPQRQQLRSVDGAAAAAAGSWPTDCHSLGCEGFVTPAVLRQAYSIPAPDAHVAAMPAGVSNSMSVAEFQGQYYEKNDLSKFSDGCGVNVTVDTVIGGDENSPGIEAELDIEYIKAISPEIPLTVIYSDDYSLSKWVAGVSNMTSPPLVHSVSYGNDEGQQTSNAFMQAVNAQFMKAGARGISILFASGDQGVCGREGCGFLFWKRYKPDFPGASPYVTAVGGTNFATRSVIGAETAWSGSGGGFSDHFAIPAWQADAVAAYKARPDAQLPPQKVYNNTGRGYPDVAALAGQVNAYCIVTGGRTGGVAGTSAASPVVASVFAKLNGLRLASGKAPLGFLNPFIYQHGAEAFNDVTSGKNSGGGLFGRDGFTATKGWDPATGWGSPNYAVLSKLVVQ